MSDGPLFPKKSEVNDEPAGPVEIERSDDPSTSTGGSSRRGMPTMQGKPIGCGSSVFGLVLVVAVIVAGRIVL